MSQICPVINGNKSCIYKYAIKLSRNNWIDLSSFAALKKSKRVFAVYQWQTGPGMRNQIFSGWMLWLTYKDRKWETHASSNDSWRWEGAPLVPAHIFFKTGEEFKEWLGPDAVKDLFVDLL